MKKNIVFALTLATSALAGPDEWLQSGLIKPEFIQQIKPSLDLSAEQETKMAGIVGEARSKGEPVEATLKEQKQELHQLLRKPDTTADAASAQLTQVLESEATIKQLQLRTLLALRDILSPEQREKAMKLSLNKAAAKGDLETLVTAKAGKLKAAVEALGETPTEAMKERGAEIEALLKSGDLQAADAALDKLIIDSQVNESVENETALDFSTYDPGNTDLDTLKERFESVKAGAQNIISIPLIKQFLQAKEAFESAKAAEDATAVGRVLTWAEHKLAKP